MSGYVTKFGMTMVDFCINKNFGRCNRVEQDGGGIQTTSEASVMIAHHTIPTTALIIVCAGGSAPTGPAGGSLQTRVCSAAPRCLCCAQQGIISSVQRT